MCGRFGFKGTPQQFEKVFGYLPPAEYHAAYNIAPTNIIVMVNKEGPAMAHWGLIFRGAKDDFFAPFNAQAATLDTKFPFKFAFKDKQTCLIPASVFYEWKKLDSKGKEKQPYAIHTEHDIMAFAGLWERNEKLNVLSCTIVTTEANDFVKPMHPERMPVILPKESWTAWLQHADKGVLIKYPDEKMFKYEVAKEVGNIRNKGPECMAPLIVA